MPSALHTFQGGTVVSGGHQVKTVQAVLSDDSYEPVGRPVTLRMQAVCWQPSEQIETDNTRAAIHAAGFDYVTKQIRRLERLRASIIAKYPTARDIPDDDLYAWEERPATAISEATAHLLEVEMD